MPRGVEIKNALQKINRVVKRANTLPWLTAGVNLKLSVQKNFDVGGRYNAASLDNSGGSNKWVPRKKNYSHPTLKKSGKLKANHSVRIIQNGVAVENRGLAYSAVHNYGYEFGNIPSRPFLVAQQNDIKDVQKMFEVHLAT